MVCGSTSDITIFRNNLSVHKRLSKKSVAALTVVNHGEGSQDHPHHHAILLDKMDSYRGHQDYRQPNDKPCFTCLTPPCAGHK